MGVCIIILINIQVPLLNSCTNSLMHAMQGGSLYHLYDGLWYDQAGMRIHDLSFERRIR